MMSFAWRSCSSRGAGIRAGAAPATPDRRGYRRSFVRLDLTTCGRFTHNRLRGTQSAAETRAHRC